MITATPETGQVSWANNSIWSRRIEWKQLQSNHGVSQHTRAEVAGKLENRRELVGVEMVPRGRRAALVVHDAEECELARSVQRLPVDRLNLSRFERKRTGSVIIMRPHAIIDANVDT
jgi:hypothetical protein